MWRRDFLQTVGGIAAATTVFAGAAAASHPDSQSDHVTRSYDEDLLQRYQPLLVTEHLDILPSGIYGQWTTSPEHETAVGVYFCEYPAQEALTSEDSHFGDHEPIYVFVDEETGDIDHVAYTGYHWLKAMTTTAPVFDDDRPKFRVVKPYHHYIVTTSEGVDVELKNLVDNYDDWLSEGLESAIYPGAVYNPWSIQTRESWWQRGTFGISVVETWWSAMHSFGLRGADKTDL